MTCMSVIDDEILACVRGCYGAVRVRDLNLTRTERRHLKRLVEAGELAAHPHGVVSLPRTDPPVVLARIHGGVITCQQAAEYYGYPHPERGQHVHLAVPHREGFAPIGRETPHVERSLELPTPTEYPVAPIALALARYLRCSRNAAAPLMACDAALRQEHIVAADVNALLRGPGSKLALERLALASPRARSPLETLARLQLHEAGVPFEDGVMIPHVGEVDIVANGWLVLELDGYTYHEDEFQFGLDRRRDRELIRQGYRVARFTRQDVKARRIALEVPELLHARSRLAGLNMSKTGTNSAFVR